MDLFLYICTYICNIFTCGIIFLCMDIDSMSRHRVASIFFRLKGIDCLNEHYVEILCSHCFDDFHVFVGDEIWFRINSLKQSVEGWDINAIKAKRLLGQPPSWPESLQGARLRYTKRFLDYMRRARHTKKGCLLVTHGYMLQAWSWMKPENTEVSTCNTDAKSWKEKTLKLGSLMPPWYSWFAPSCGMQTKF